MRLLLVDDDPMILLLASRVLEGAGYEVRTAASGAGALEAARRDPPDALLLDLFLDDMDGDALLAGLRELPGVEAIPAVFLTGEQSAAQVERLEALGARGVIHKPFAPDLLAEQVRTLLGPR